MNLPQTPTLKFRSDLAGTSHLLEVRRARMVWRDKDGKVLLVAFHRHPEAVLYTHKTIMRDHPSMTTEALPSYGTMLKEQGYHSIKVIVLYGKPKQLAALAVTRYWKLDGRAAAAGRKEIEL